MPRSSAFQINARIENRAPGFVQRMHNLVTPERTFEVFRHLADTYAPSLTTRHTRAPVLAALLQSAQEEGLYEGIVDFELNYLQTGVAAAFLGTRHSVRTWSVAHLDNISYLTEPRQEEGYPIDSILPVSAKSRQPSRSGFEFRYSGWASCSGGQR